MKALFPLLALLALAACGPSVPECGPATCGGCCDPSGVCQSGGATNACGSNGLACTACFASQSCSLGTCRAAVTCTPATCAGLGKNCGQVDNGCGGTLECGGCGTGESCGAGGVTNVCGAGTCTPKTCTGQSFDCGKVSDGCSAILDCGTCGSGFCGGGGANKCGACQPKSCTELGKNCGLVDDGCGTMTNCGGCTSPNSCGGGGTANVCGTGACVPRSCTELGKNCGMVSDGCGNMLTCGTCSGFATCGGAGTTNVCGASCAVSCPTGFSCNAMGVCAGGNLATLVLNEVGHAVSGKVTVNGAQPSEGVYCASSGNFNDEIARVVFTDSSKGYNASVSILCTTTDFSFATLLPPGSYEVRVQRGGYATSAQVNLLPVSYQAVASLVVSAPVSNLVLNEVGHAVSGKVTVNGAQPTKGVYCASSGNFNDEIARVSFRDSSKGYNATVSILCTTTDFSFATLLPPGTYEVRVERGGYATSAQVNLLPVSYQAVAALGVAAPVGNLVLDEVGHAVSGKVTVNGAQPTKGVYCASSGNFNDEIARVVFTDSAKGYSATVSILCTTTDFSFATLLPPGSYEVRVQRGGYATSAQVNLIPVSYLARSGLAVSGPVTNLVLDEQGFAVSGRVTVNGAQPTKGVYCGSSGNFGDEIARVELSDASKGYNATVSILCSTTDFSFATLLPPGNYEVRVQRGGYATAAQVNLLPVSYQAVASLAVSAPVSNLVLNEVGFAVSGKVTVNGAQPTKGVYCASSGNFNDEIARVQFTDSSKGYGATVSILCTTSDFSFATLLPAGTYEVRVQRGGYATSAQVNLLPVSYQAMTGLVVSAPVANLALNEQGFTVSGRVTVNGAQPTKGSYCSSSGNFGDEIARVQFTDSSRSYNASVSIPCTTTDFSFSTLLPTGAYEVRVERGGYATAAQVNLLPVSYLAIGRLAVP